MSEETVSERYDDDDAEFEAESAATDQMSADDLQTTACSTEMKKADGDKSGNDASQDQHGNGSAGNTALEASARTRYIFDAWQENVTDGRTNTVDAAVEISSGGRTTEEADQISDRNIRVAGGGEKLHNNIAASEVRARNELTSFHQSAHSQSRRSQCVCCESVNAGESFEIVAQGDYSEYPHGQLTHPASPIGDIANQDDTRYRQVPAAYTASENGSEPTLAQAYAQLRPAADRLEMSAEQLYNAIAIDIRNENTLHYVQNRNEIVHELVEILREYKESDRIHERKANVYTMLKLMYDIKYRSQPQQQAHDNHGDQQDYDRAHVEDAHQEPRTGQNARSDRPGNQPGSSSNDSVAGASTSADHSESISQLEPVPSLEQITDFLDLLAKEEEIEVYLQNRNEAVRQIHEMLLGIILRDFSMGYFEGNNNFENEESNSDELQGHENQAQEEHDNHVNHEHGNRVHEENVSGHSQAHDNPEYEEHANNELLSNDSHAYQEQDSLVNIDHMNGHAQEYGNSEHNGHNNQKLHVHENQAGQENENRAGQVHDNREYYGGPHHHGIPGPCEFHHHGYQGHFPNGELFKHDSSSHLVHEDEHQEHHPQINNSLCKADNHTHQIQDNSGLQQHNNHGSLDCGFLGHHDVYQDVHREVQEHGRPAYQVLDSGGLGFQNNQEMHEYNFLGHQDMFQGQISYGNNEVHGYNNYEYGEIENGGLQRHNNQRMPDYSFQGPRAPANQGQDMQSDSRIYAHDQLHANSSLERQTNRELPENMLCGQQSGFRGLNLHSDDESLDQDGRASHLRNIIDLQEHDNREQHELDILGHRVDVHQEHHLYSHCGIHEDDSGASHENANDYLREDNNREKQEYDIIRHRVDVQEGQNALSNGGIHEHDNCAHQHSDNAAHQDSSDCNGQGHGNSNLQGQQIRDIHGNSSLLHGDGQQSHTASSNNCSHEDINPIPVNQHSDTPADQVNHNIEHQQVNNDEIHEDEHHIHFLHPNHDWMPPWSIQPHLDTSLAPVAHHPWLLPHNYQVMLNPTHRYSQIHATDESSDSEATYSSDSSEDEIRPIVRAGCKRKSYNDTDMGDNPKRSRADSLNESTGNGSGQSRSFIFDAADVADHSSHVVAQNNGTEHYPSVAQYGGTNHLHSVPQHSGAGHPSNVTQYSGTDHLSYVAWNSGMNHSRNGTPNSGMDLSSGVAQHSRTDHLRNASQNSGISHSSRVTHDTGTDHSSSVAQYSGADHLHHVAQYSGTDHSSNVTQDSETDQLRNVAQGTTRRCTKRRRDNDEDSDFNNNESKKSKNK